MQSKKSFLSVCGSANNEIDEILIFEIHELIGNDTGAHFLHWNQNSKFWVTWPRIAQSVYFLREMCIFQFLNDKIHNYVFFFDIDAWNV